MNKYTHTDSQSQRKHDKESTIRVLSNELITNLYIYIYWLCRYIYEKVSVILFIIRNL